MLLKGIGVDRGAGPERPVTRSGRLVGVVGALAEVIARSAKSECSVELDERTAQ